jgi:predicted TIM-barrel fold metal-dependent hydrolase
MARTAIISVDGHVKAQRAGYREYIERSYLEDFDDWVKALEAAGMPDAGNIQPELGEASQWDSDQRLRDLESQGVVAEVLFPNGLAFQEFRFEDSAKAPDPGLDRQARMAYNRWLVDFCGQAPGRRAGNVSVSFDDLDQAVADIHWAKEEGLDGVLMPALYPGDRFFFDPALDPVWAACQEVELPVVQHGGLGMPRYSPMRFAALMTVSVESNFYSSRSMWQMMVGGVFDRFTKLHVAFVETGVDWIAATIKTLDERLGQGDDWMGFAEHLDRERACSRLPSEYWADNCSAGISPFSPLYIPFDQIIETGEQFRLGSDHVMFGVDYPHFESIFPNTKDTVSTLIGTPVVTGDDAQKILFDNAARIFGFDVAVLQPHVDRVGFEL